MASINKVIILGYLGDDPKVETLPNGAKKTTISIATTEKGYTTKSGSTIPDRTEWHRVIFWERLAELCERHLHKGSLIYIEGSIRTRSWDDKDGVKHYATEIDGKALQLLEKRENDSTAPSAQSNAPQGPKNRQPYSNEDLTPKDDDLPF